MTHHSAGLELLSWELLPLPTPNYVRVVFVRLRLCPSIGTALHHAREY